MRVEKTAIKLADGRDLIYFDSGPAAGRDAADRRHMAAVHPAAELRFDPLLRVWVMYAGYRQERSYLPSAADCPLCPSTATRDTEIPAHDYEVVVFENRFPALTRQPDGGCADHGRGVAAESGQLVRCRPSAGRCEVICFTSDHNASFAELSPERARLVTEALIDRTRELSAEPGVEQVYCFENRGREIGVTQPHPHGQIYAYPFVTPRTERMLAGAASYADRTGRNVFDDLVAAERADGSRVVRTGTYWVAFVPHAARWPYEVHCYPLRRVPDLESLLPAERDDLAVMQLDLLGRFSRLFDRPAPYIAAWHQAPVRAGRDGFGLHLELFTLRRSNDKLKYLAGSESGMDAFADDIMPEQAAARLRELG
jgi:UDPglucose--hexose-1-phosphate uridylyltransferase